MPFTKPEKQENPSFRQQWPGMLIFFVVVVGSQFLAYQFRKPVMEWLSLTDGRPGQDPPWYFINQDFAEGVCAAGVLALSLMIAIVIWRWWATAAGMIAWMSLIWMGGHVAKAWIIFQYCPGLLEGQRNTERWPTFDSYLNDPLIDGSQTGVLIGSVLLSFGLPMADRHFRKKRSAQ